MSGESSSVAEWFTRLEPVTPPADLVRRRDDPRLADVVEFWTGGPPNLQPGRAVLIGFPQDEGLVRNHARPGAAESPREIRSWLYRLTPWDGDFNVDLKDLPPLDLGNIRIAGTMEVSQEALAEVVAAVLTQGAVPIVLGGGHETAYGHYLGYVRAGRQVGIINIDAHLDVRPCIGDQGHCGSPFRQALEHPTHPLPGPCYICLGAQPQSVGHAHWQYVHDRGGIVRWASEVEHRLGEALAAEVQRIAQAGCHTYVSVDADAFRAADVPGVSAVNPTGLAGEQMMTCARRAGQAPAVSSLDLVEISPRYDRDGQSARWGALVIWNFLIGLALRNSCKAKASIEKE
jgi:formiminoglutamase